MDTVELLKKQGLNPERIDENKPSFGIVVPPSAFSVPEGWEFVLSRPFEGVSYIASVLNNAGYRIKIIDLRSTDNPIGQALRDSSEVDVIGLATYEDSFVFIEDFIAQIKKENPEKLIFLGGSLVTSVPTVLMENTKADIAVLGEGELTILELMELIAEDKLKDINKIPGLCYKDTLGNLIFTEKRAQMKDLDSLPTMNLNLWPDVQRNPRIKEILFSHSRGCYMNCSFCYRTTPNLSLKSIDKFRQELMELRNKHEFEFIYFVDLTFAIQKERTLALCEVLMDFDLKWSCMCRVQHLDSETLKKMKKAGCQIILYGFESLDQDILNNAKKGTSTDEIRDVFLLTQDVGIQVGGLFILGLPGETRKSLLRVIKFIEETKTACRVKYLSAIPGTEVYYLALKKGLIKSEVEHLRWLSKEKGEADDDFLNFTELPQEELRMAYRKVNSLYIKGPRLYESWF